MTPRHSVVMTAFNEEEWIAAAIASVLAQTHTDFELIVVDDGSNDGTVAVVRGFDSDPRLRLIQQENAGLSAARNTGIAASKTEWVSFLDSDDLWMPEYLARVDEILAEHPKSGFAYVDAWRLSDDGRFFRQAAMARQDPPEHPPRDAAAFLELLVRRGNFIFVSTTVRRAALEAVGGFRTELTSVEDYDLWIRILAAGYEAAHPAGRLAIKRDRPTAMSANEAKMAVNLRDVYRLTEREYEVPPEVRRIAAAHADELDGEIAEIERAKPLRTVKLRLRLALGRAQRRSLQSRIWHEQTPAEVAAAFPALADPSDRRR